MHCACIVKRPSLLTFVKTKAIIGLGFDVPSFCEFMYTLLFYKQHFYKQRQAEIGQKPSNC